MIKVGLVGAVNVGKSTLFNRLIGTYRAIVTEIAGTTRDIIREVVDFTDLWAMEFQDSPGLLDFNEEMVYIRRIIKECDLILFVIDGKQWVTAREELIKLEIIKAGKKNQTVLVANKMEGNFGSRKYDQAIAPFYEVGFDKVIGISAKNADNLDLVSDVIHDAARAQPKVVYEVDPNIVNIAIVGKPNAGKSSLLNLLIGKELSKVEDKDGTTLDYVIGEKTIGGTTYKFFDTLGMRKKSMMHGLEKIAYDKTSSMLRFVKPLVIFMIDVSKSITHRDMTLLREMTDMHVPLIIAINKVDLIDEKALKKQLQLIHNTLDFATYIPIVSLSVTEGKWIQTLLQKAGLVWKTAHQRISTAELNKIISTAFIRTPPRFARNRVCKIYYGSQVSTYPTDFVFFINDMEKANFAFKKWIDNVIRKEHPFIGVPLMLSFRDKKEAEKKKESLQDSSRHYNEQ